MRNYLRSTWRENNGWWLVGSAALVGGLLSLLWFFQMFPDLWVASTSNQPILSQTVQAKNSILVAQVNASEEAGGKRGFLLLYRPDGLASDAPAYQQAFELDDSGAVTVLMVLPPGIYRAVAFLDLNDSGQLDFEGDQPLEPIRFPKSRFMGGSGELQSPAEITLAPKEPVFCLFDFADK